MPQFCTPPCTPHIHNSYLSFIYNLDPPSRYPENKIEIFLLTFTPLWSPKCVLKLQPKTCILTDAQMPMTPYIYSSLVPINSPTQKGLQTSLVNIQYFGVKYGYLHVLDLPPLSFMFCLPVLNISPFGKYHST